MNRLSSTQSIKEAIAEAASILRESGIAEARREAGSLLSHTIGRDRMFLIMHDDEPLTLDQSARFSSFVKRRAAGEPLQYITGHQEFYGLDFEVTPAVLIPRPETELLVEIALDLLKDTKVPTICDVGAGSGCIAIALVHTISDARAVALDISPAAIEVAKRNAIRHSVSERISFLVSDCFSALNPATNRFNIIVSNPPYIAEHEISKLQREVRDHEPRIALTPSGGDGLKTIRQLLNQAPQFLLNSGYLVFEIGYNQHEAITDLINPHTWQLLDIHKDLQGIPRTVVLQFV